MSTVESLRDELKQKSRKEKFAKLIELLVEARDNCEVSVKTLVGSQIDGLSDEALDNVIMKAYELAALPQEITDDVSIIFPF